MSIRQLLELTEARRMAKSGRAGQLRLAAGLTLAEVGRAVGVSEATVWRWEHGQRRPGGQPALAYARLLARLSEDADEEETSAG